MSLYILPFSQSRSSLGDTMLDCNMWGRDPLETSFSFTFGLKTILDGIKACLILLHVYIR